MNDQSLFAGDDLRSYLDNRRQHVLSEVERFDANRLLNSNVEDLALYFAGKYEVSIPTIRENEIVADQAETPIDVSGRFDYGGSPGERIVIPGTKLTLHVPFDGEIELIRFFASTRSLNPLRGRTSGQEVILTFEAPSVELGRAKAHFDKELSELRQHLSWTVTDLKQFNDSLPHLVQEAVESRRTRLLASQKAVASLGYPLKQRADAPATYVVPDVKLKAVPTPPPASDAPYVPEPALSDAIYEQILTVLANMVRVMEQSPEAFSTLGEQDLRTHFLVQLNGQFEGRASGETFHGSGKTDILLTEKDKSVFIAECKFWDGPASLTGAIDQVLDYATWRDAKAAILLFSRNADFSAVVQQVPGVIASHPQSRGSVSASGETVFRSRVRHRDDSTREIIITTLIYNIPRSRTTSQRLRPRKGRGSA